MYSFDELSEREVLALAISLEEEDARIYADLADGLHDQYPEQARQFDLMRQEEDGHRHRLLDRFDQRFGDHVPLIRREDVKGFVSRTPVWLARPLEVSAAQKQAAVMELETRQFYEAAMRRTTGAGTRQQLGDLAEAERKHEQLAEAMRETPAADADAAAKQRMFVHAGL